MMTDPREIVGGAGAGTHCLLPRLAAIVMVPVALTAFASAAAGQEATAAKPPRLAPLGLEQLMEIEVTTVTRRESTVGRSAAAVHVITQEDIRRSGATAIPELFRRVPGMNVAKMDNNKWAVSARGFNDRLANKLLVQIDGRVLYNPLFSGVFWDSVDYPLEDIDRIEVIRGPGASLWGANAVNGIINIITKAAAETQGGLLTAGIGNEEKGFGTLRYGSGRGEDLTYRLYGKGFDRDEQFLPAGDADDDWASGSSGFRADWQRSARDQVTFQGDLLWSEPGSMSLLPQTAPPYLFISREPETTTDANLLGRWTHQVSEDSSWMVHFYWERLDRELKSMEVDLEWDTYDLDFQHQLQAGDRHMVVYGAGYRLVDMFGSESERDDGFFLSWDENRRQYYIISGFGQDEIELLANTWRLILGSKFEHNRLTGFEVQPTARLLWTPSEAQTFWAAVSRAVRTPHRAETGSISRSLPLSTAPPVFPQVVGNSALDSENMLAYELGHRVQATVDFSVDSAIFYNRYQEISTVMPGAIEPGPAGTFTLPLIPLNGLEAETYGAELAATWQVTRRWQLYGAYTYLAMDVQREVAGLSPAVEEIEEQSPRHQIYLQSSLDLPGGLEFDLMGRYTDEATGLTSGGVEGMPSVIDSYLALDARLAWKPRRDLTLEVVGRNLLDDHHPEFGTSPFFISVPTEIERDVYGKATWRF